jgi:hypothetical protein
MFTARDFVWMLVIPGAIGLVISLVGALVRFRRGTAPLAVALSFLIAFPLILSGRFSLPAIPPPASLGSKGWLPLIAVMALVVGLLDSFVRLPVLVRGIVVAVITAIGLSLLLKFKFATWTTLQTTEVIGAFAIAAAIWACVIEDSVTSMPLGSLLVTWMIASVSAVVLMLIATLESGQFYIVLAACGFANLPALLWKPSQNALRGFASIFSILLISFLVSAYFTSELVTLQLVILIAPPIFLFLTRRLPIRWKPWQRAAVRIAVTFIPLAAGLALAAVRFGHEQQQESAEQMH